MQTEASKCQQRSNDGDQSISGRLPAIEDAVAALQNADYPATAQELAKFGDALLCLHDGFQALYHAYVAQLEDSSRRITDLGGSSHPVAILEENDPALMVARALLARIGGVL